MQPRQRATVDKLQTSVLTPCQYHITLHYTALHYITSRYITFTCSTHRASVSVTRFCKRFLVKSQLLQLAAVVVTLIVLNLAVGSQPLDLSSRCLQDHTEQMAESYWLLVRTRGWSMLA
jgi:hypothetical protein